MILRTGFALLLVCGLGSAAVCLLKAEDPTKSSGSSGKAIAHDLYFTLKDNSEENRAALIAEAKRCLAPHPGIAYFSTGVMTEDLKKGLFVDSDFDVVVHMVFENRQALKTYAKTKLHNEFVAQQSNKFKKFRIFDSEVERYEPSVAAK